MKNTAFQQIEPFKQASSASINQLSQSAKRHVYKKNTILLDHCKATHTFLYVTNGWVKLFKESAEGEEIILDVLTKGHYCGDEFLFSAEEADAYSVQAATEVEVITLPLSAVKKLLVFDNGLLLGFLEQALKKQRHMHIETEHLNIQNAAQRIGCFILRLCDQHNGQKMTVTLPYDKLLLASRLGMRGETFSRALKKLSKECNLKVHAQTVEITCRDQLVKYICPHCSKTFPCEIIHELTHQTR